MITDRQKKYFQRELLTSALCVMEKLDKKLKNRLFLRF